jgi:phospholipid/cholesterol/gamma-HCH transport system substrate-binding protein
MTATPYALRRLVAGVLAGVVVAVLAVILLEGDDEHAHLRIVSTSALGLRDGSGVRLGGVLVGKVSKLSLTDDDKVQIDLAIDDKDVRVGRNPSVTIKSLNLLGEKYAALDPGDITGPEQTDVTIPPSRVTTATDLDQVLDVLDADTRTRLAILINEAGLAMTGRHADFNALLGKLPPALTSATGLLKDVVSDNHTLAELIQHSDAFLGRTLAQKADLRAFIDEAATAAETFADRSGSLRSTLAKAPAGLASLRGFLADLRTTAAPLGAAARNISATAPPLADTLQQVKPFRDAAKPTLRQATDVAPALTELGDKATPVIKAAVPTLQSLETFSQRVVPVTKVLGISTPDLLGVLEGWGRAIQGRDGRGHAFHGGVTFGAGMVQTLLQPPGDGVSTKKQAKTETAKAKPGVPAKGAPSLPAAVTDLLPKVAETPKKLLEDLPKAVKDLPKTIENVLKGLTGQKPAGEQPPSGGAKSTSVQSLLDYLLKP